MIPPLICEFCDDPLDESEVGIVRDDVVVCAECLSLAEVSA